MAQRTKGVLSEDELNEKGFRIFHAFEQISEDPTGSGQAVLQELIQQVTVLFTEIRCLAEMLDYHTDEIELLKLELLESHRKNDALLDEVRAIRQERDEAIGEVELQAEIEVTRLECKIKELDQEKYSLALHVYELEVDIQELNEEKSKLEESQVSNEDRRINSWKMGCSSSTPSKEEHDVSADEQVLVDSETRRDSEGLIAVDKLLEMDRLVEENQRLTQQLAEMMLASHVTEDALKELRQELFDMIHRTPERYRDAESGMTPNCLMDELREADDFDSVWGKGTPWTYGEPMNREQSFDFSTDEEQHGENVRVSPTPDMDEIYRRLQQESISVQCELYREEIVEKEEKASFLQRIFGVAKAVVLFPFKVSWKIMNLMWNGLKITINGTAKFCGAVCEEVKGIICRSSK